jgi:hypothetical protein
MSICRKVSRWRKARREKKEQRLEAERRLYWRMMKDGFPADYVAIPAWLIWSCHQRLEKDPDDELAHHTIDMLEAFNYGKVVSGPNAERCP